MLSKSSLVRVATKSSLPEPGKVKEFIAQGKSVCIANVSGEICAADNVCPHWGGPLGQGRIQDGEIVCPWHGWQFDLKTGETRRNANVRLAIYRVIIEEEDIFIAL